MFIVLFTFMFRAVVSLDEKCAIFLPLQFGGPSIVGHSHSHFHQHFFLDNVLRARRSPGPCITYENIETAILIAMEKRVIPITPPIGRPWEVEDIKQVGEILLDVSFLLSQQFSLPPSVIYEFLPKIDIAKTSLINICPDFASPMKCKPLRYRRFDGLCNNLQYPTWGATRAVFQRLLPPVYSDGIHAPRVSVIGGGPLPPARLVSAQVHRDEGFHNHDTSLLIVAWGQLMDHDFTLTATPLDPVTRNEPEDCCNVTTGVKNPYCFEIYIPKEDKFYNLFGTKCIDFVRGFPGVRQNCHLGPAAQFNILTGVIDGNTIYGGSERSAKELRTGVGGLLREFNAFNDLGLRPLLPLKTDIPDEGCTRRDESQRCFLAGEIRVNEQLILTCAHTMMMREHNRIARKLHLINPHWDDERLYQESRHIVAALIQHITFNEFLPQLLGLPVMEKLGLIIKEDGYWDGYDPTVNPSMSSAFVTSAFRFGHSLLPSSVQRWSPNHKYIGSRRLSTLIRQPYDLFRPGWMDEYILGLMNQPAEVMDVAITQEVTNHLFQDPQERFGVDLVAFNLQRGREFGIPGYTAYRKFCGLEPVYTFEDLNKYMTNLTAKRYASVYKHVDDIDLWSGGVSEVPVPNGLVGPTFACIIGTQLSFLRRGDRFWYELPNQPSSFTPEQLKAIKQVRLARILCDNTDHIDTIQLHPMVLPDYTTNPRVSCKSGVISHLDLTPWTDIGFKGPLNPGLGIGKSTSFFEFLSDFPFGFASKK